MKTRIEIVIRSKEFAKRRESIITREHCYDSNVIPAKAGIQRLSFGTGFPIRSGMTKQKRTAYMMSLRIIDNGLKGTHTCVLHDK